MDSLPLEILDIIARAGGYRGLLCLRGFADSLSVSRRVDFMIELGYSIEITCGYVEWKHNNDTHRVGGPALIWYDGTEQWYVNGKRHRTDGPAVKYSNGTEWYLNDQRHRIGGPAIELRWGYKAWCVDGKPHRIDGPAVESSNGYKEWWINGQRIRNLNPS